jgi:hypothetical protein
MAIMVTKMVQMEQVCLIYPIMSDGYMRHDRVRNARFVLPCAAAKET